MTGLSTMEKEILITRTFDAEPDHRYTMPTPTPWPFLAAVATAVMFVGGLFTVWAFVIGLPIAGIIVTCWFWPTTPRKEGEAPA